MEPGIPTGNCIRIDRKTGAILQIERETPESLARAIDQVARVLAAGLLAKKREALYAVPKKGARPVQRSNAPTPKGAINNPDDTSIVRQAWRWVKRFAALLGCVILALMILLFVGAPIEGDMSWSASVALTGTAGWLCWMCYKVAAEEEDKEQ